MEDAAREAAVDTLVRDSDAVRDSVEIARLRRSGDRVTVLARWTEARTGRSRRGAVDVDQTDGAWRAAGGWSSNANHDSDNPAAATVRFRHTDGSRVEADILENGATILFYEPVADRTSIFEILDKDGTVLHVVPFG